MHIILTISNTHQQMMIDDQIHSGHRCNYYVYHCTASEVQLIKLFFLPTALDSLGY